MTFCTEIPMRQLENKILDLNHEGFTVSKSTICGNTVTLFFDETKPMECLRRRTLTLDHNDIDFIESTRKTKRFSAEKFLGFFKNWMVL